jgi:dTDP-4-amino-4,6-dideoxygalactose transaminase
MKIPITKTFFTPEEIEKVSETLQSGWIVQGPKVREFEQMWCEFTGAGNSVAVSNCTCALHLCLHALGVTYGDEVIVPSFTWIATANSVEAVGATPVFCDINTDTFNIDVSLIEQLITHKTKAIIPVHLFGLSAEMDKINSLAAKYNMLVIEDAACGFGAMYRNVHVGRLGICGCFSFHPRKAVTTGEGGMITTDDDSLAEKLRAMRDHGAKVSDHRRHIGAKPYIMSEFPYMGFNFRMTDIQASLGASQMKRAKEILSSRLRLAEKYDKLLDSVSWLRKPYRHPDYVHGFQAYVCLFAPEKITRENVKTINEMRNHFMEYLNENGISTRPGTHAIHMLEYYRKKYNLKDEDYFGSMTADLCSIAFPLYPAMNDDEFNYIAEKILSYEVN